MSLKRVTVLVTGGGAPGSVGTFYALRNNPSGTPVTIISCDMRGDAVGKYLADKFYVVPSGRAPDYLDAMLEIVERDHVDVVLPQTTDELSALASHVEEFHSRGVKVAIPPIQSVERANDKWRVLEAAKARGVPLPKSFLTFSEKTLVKAVNALGYPDKKVVVKPRVSSGLRGVRVLSEEIWDVERFLREKPEPMEISLRDLIPILRRGKWPELIVQEYLPGPEYTVDVFRGQGGVIAIPRLRKLVRAGITFQGEVDFRKDLQSFALDLAEELNLWYVFGFQFKLSTEGIPKVLECNPRVQGTMVISVFAGYNIIWWAVKEALGEGVTLPNDGESNGLQFIRYWGGIAVEKNGTIIGAL